MEQVLKLDEDCEEAVIDLFNCKVLQLMVHTLAHSHTLGESQATTLPLPTLLEGPLLLTKLKRVTSRER